MSYKWLWKESPEYQQLYREHWNDCALLNKGDHCTCDKPQRDAALQKQARGVE